MSDPHREACRRQHRVIGNFLAMQAWLLGVDCLVLVRGDLQKFLKLERFKSTRVEWLTTDLRPWFPYRQEYYRSSALSSIHSLFLSRVPIKTHLPSGTMTTPQRVARMAEDAPKTKFFSEAPSGKMHDENDIISQLALLASGLMSPPKKPVRRVRRRTT